MPGIIPGIRNFTDGEKTMLRAMIEEACALIALALFLGMLFTWGGVISHGVQITRLGAGL